VSRGLPRALSCGQRCQSALTRDSSASASHRGLEGRVRSGMSGAGIRYGYDLVPRAARIREAQRSRAAVVVRIFEEYVAGSRSRDWSRR
jgi:hypothetical protein